MNPTIYVLHYPAAFVTLGFMYSRVVHLLLGTIKEDLVELQSRCKNITLP